MSVGKSTAVQVDSIRNEAHGVVRQCVSGVQWRHNQVAIGYQLPRKIYMAQWPR